MNTTMRLKPLLLATAAVGCLFAGAQHAAAQSEPNASDDVIRVTGTRINNPNLEQASQIQVVGEDEISLRSVNAAEELLRQLPGAVPSIGPAIGIVNQGNNGVQTINLRGIGQNRNLILIDGRRIVPFDIDGVSDLNHIPIALLERVDIVTGGASSVYGADAIAGLANFITKDNFEGVELDSSYRISQRGDGEVFRSELLIGGDFAEGRGNAVFSLGYQDANAVLQGDRVFSEFNISSITGAPGGSATSAPTVVSGPGLSGQINPETGVIEPGITPFNFNPLNLFQTPVERFNIYGKGHYEVVDGIEVYGEGFFTRSRILTQIAPTGTFFSTFQLPISNPFLPDPARDQICAAYGISPAECLAAGAATNASDPAYREVPIGFGRRFVEAGPRQNIFNTDAFQIVGGLRGDIGGNWSWNFGGQYGESTLTETLEAFGLFSRVQQALRASDQTTCANPANDCVPLNLFGPIGSVTDEQFAFLNAPATTTTNATLAVASLNIDGDLGEFRSPWANSNPIGVALGGEYRRYTANTAGDFLSRQPGELIGPSADPSIVGSYDVIEGYLELIAPVVEERRFVENFNIEAGARVSNYSSTGTSVTWKAGGNWEIFEGYKIRSIYQSAVRSPNIGELFNPIAGNIGNLATDPCAGSAPVDNPALGAICIAQGAPSAAIGLISNPASGQVNITVGGNPNLDVERAATFTSGVIVQPAQIDNLTLTLDYFNISIDGAISAPTTGDVVSGCYDPEFNPNFTFNAFCAQIFRNRVDGSLDGSVVDTPGVVLLSSNQGRINTSGFDFGVAYDYDAGAVGQFTYQLNGTYTIENRFQAAPTSADRECIGFYSTNCANVQPEWQFNERLTWSYGIFDVSLRHRFLSGSRVEPLANEVIANNPSSAGFGVGFLPEFQRIPGYNYVDLTLRAAPTGWVQLAVTIDNLLDNEPPIVGNGVGSTAFNTGNTYPTVYDAIGRTFTVSARLRF